jgi:hypothetical protein
MWVGEYRKTVCHSGVYMLLIRKGRKMSDEWIYDIAPKEQIDSINEQADKTLFNFKNRIKSLKVDSPLKKLKKIDFSLNNSF